MVEKVKRKKGKPDLLARFRSLFNALQQAGLLRPSIHSPHLTTTAMKLNFHVSPLMPFPLLRFIFSGVAVIGRCWSVRWQLRCLSMTNQRRNYHFPQMALYVGEMTETCSNDSPSLRQSVLPSPRAPSPSPPLSVFPDEKLINGFLDRNKNSA